MLRKINVNTINGNTAIIEILGRGCLKKVKNNVKTIFMYCTQNLGHKIGGAVFMSKLTRKDKIEIYERNKNGETIASLAKAFNVNKIVLHYLIRLIRKHGYDIIGNGENKHYSKEFKLQIINRILVNNESINSVAIDVGLASSGLLHNWLSKFKENGYNVIEKKRGRKPKAMTKPKKKNDKALSEKDKIKQLEDEILYLKAENEYLKKLRALVQERELKEKKK